VQPALSNTLVQAERQCNSILVATALLKFQQDWQAVTNAVNALLGAEQTNLALLTRQDCQQVTFCISGFDNHNKLALCCHLSLLKLQQGRRQVHMHYATHAMAIQKQHLPSAFMTQCLGHV